MKLKFYELTCKLLSKIYHQTQKRGFGTTESVTEYWIEEICKKHNDLVDKKRNKIKSPRVAMQKYPYIAIGQYTWD